MQEVGTVKMVKRTFCQDNCDSSHKGISKEKNVLLCQEPGFLEVTKTDFDSKNTPRLPMVCFVTVKGLVISCHRRWTKSRSGVWENMKNGAHDVLDPRYAFSLRRR
jgi:hypothetical protein